MREENRIVHGIWLGPRLTNMQRLCIRSYQDNGHEFHLWAEHGLARVPEGTVLRNVNEIFPLGDRERFSGTNFMSDYFRAKLLHEIGGWYVDTDTVCLQPFDFEAPYVFVSEPEDLGPMRDVSQRPVPPLETRQHYLSHCIAKLPKDNEICMHICARINGSDTKHPSDWIAFGPRMFADVVYMLKMEQYAMPPVTFDAVNYNEGNHVVAAGVPWRFSKKSYAIHFRASGWIHAGRDFDGNYPPDSLYEQLKRKHGV